MIDDDIILSEGTTRIINIRRLDWVGLGENLGQECGIIAVFST